MSLHNILVVFVFFTAMTIAYGSTYLKTTKLYCATNPKFVYNYTCNLKALNRYKSVATMEAWVIDKLDNPYVNFATFVRNSANAYKPFVINGTTNICQLLKGQKQGPYGGVVTAKDAYFDTSFLQVPFPMNSYKVVLTFYENDPEFIIGHIDLYLDFLEDNKKD